MTHSLLLLVPSVCVCCFTFTLPAFSRLPQSGRQSFCLSINSRASLAHCNSVTLTTSLLLTLPLIYCHLLEALKLSFLSALLDCHLNAMTADTISPKLVKKMSTHQCIVLMSVVLMVLSCATRSLASPMNKVSDTCLIDSPVDVIGRLVSRDTCWHNHLPGEGAGERRRDITVAGTHLSHAPSMTINRCRARMQLVKLIQHCRVLASYLPNSSPPLSAVFFRVPSFTSTPTHPHDFLFPVTSTW